MEQFLGYTKQRIATIGYLVFFALIIIAGRLLQLQIALRDQFVARGQKNFLRMESTDSPRGNILDRNGVMLVTNRPITDICWQGSGQRSLTPEQLEKLKRIEELLNTHLLDDNDLMLRIKQAERQRRALPLYAGASGQQVAQLVELFPADENISIGHHFERHYPHQTMASHVIGYLNNKIDPDGTQGKMGLERILECTLRGERGTIMRTIDSSGQSIAEIELQKGRIGSDVVTTLDTHLQKIAESVFPTDYAGALIIMDPHDGDILGVVSRPEFDPRLFLRPITPESWHALQEQRPFLNRAFNACYPPGSTFKLVCMSAALEHNLIDMNHTVMCQGYEFCGSRKYWCNKRQGHGLVTTAQALAHSCNILFYEIGKQIDIDILADYASKFGLGKKSGILFSENEGLVPSRQWKKESKGESWWQGETLSVAIGQSFLLVTPLQVARMVASIFTGYLVKPRMLINETIEREPLGIDEETRLFLLKSMKSVVKRGTGRRIKTVQDIIIYAKTSTAQVSRFEKRKLGNEFLEHGWFVATFFYKDYKPLTLVILVENSGTSAVATTVAKNFLIAYKQLLDKR